MEKQTYRSIIFHYVEAELNPTEIHKKLVEVHKKDAPGISIVRRWARQFKCGNKSMEDAPRPGRPSCITRCLVKAVSRAIGANPHIGIRTLASDLKSSNGTVGKIIRDHLGLVKSSGKWVP